MTWVIKATWAIIILWKPCFTPIILTYNNDSCNKQIFRALLCMKIAPCLISKHKPIMHSLWIASHLRVVPYFSMKLYYHLLLILSLLMLLSLLFYLCYYSYTIKGFKIATCTLTAQQLFTEEIENVMVWSANWNQRSCNVVVNISYQTVNTQETFKNFLEMF